MVWIALFRARSTAVEPVAGGAPTAGLERAGPTEGGERGLAAAAPGVGERHDDLGGADRTDPLVVGQPGREVTDDGGQESAVGLELAALLAQRDRESAQLAVADGLGAGGLSGLAT